MIFSLNALLYLFTLSSLITGFEDNISPSIKLYSPLEFSECYPGGSLVISAKLVDDNVLDNFQVKIRKGGTNSLEFVKCFSCNHLVDSKLDAHGNAIPKIEGKRNVRLNFPIGIGNDAIVGDYYLFFEVKDKNGNKCERKVSFSVSRN